MRFYCEGLGAQECHREDDFLMLAGPGEHDLIALNLQPDAAGRQGGLLHFGFRLTSADQIDTAVERLVAAGGTVRERGDRGENQPYVFVIDPDGYEIEIWHMNAPAHAQS